jgi:hypothetical protein
MGGEKGDNPLSMTMELGGKAENGEVMHSVGDDELVGGSTNESPIGLSFGRK